MAVRVGLGISVRPFAEARTFFRWVDLCEERGVDSLWQTDRLASTEPYFEALSLMGVLAGATERMRFGMNAVVVSMRDPLLLAKQCGTIDWISGGRLLPVFGVGRAHAPEWAAAGLSAKGRGKRADEALEIMTQLWTQESVDFDGEFYQYRGASIAPRPVQKPLPLWIGGSSAAAIRRTARFGTGWLAGLQSVESVGETVAAIRTASAEAGRPIPEDHYGATFPFRLGSPDDEPVQRMARAYAAAVPEVAPEAFLAVGGAGVLLERLADYRRRGVSKFALIPMAQGDDDLLEQTERLVAEVIPEAHGWD